MLRWYKPMYSLPETGASALDCIYPHVYLCVSLLLSRYSDVPIRWRSGERLRDLATAAPSLQLLRYGTDFLLRFNSRTWHTDSSQDSWSHGCSVQTATLRDFRIARRDHILLTYIEMYRKQFTLYSHLKYRNAGTPWYFRPVYPLRRQNFLKTIGCLIVRLIYSVEMSIIHPHIVQEAFYVDIT